MKKKGKQKDWSFKGTGVGELQEVGIFKHSGKEVRGHISEYWELYLKATRGHLAISHSGGIESDLL